MYFDRRIKIVCSRLSAKLWCLLSTMKRSDKNLLSTISCLENNRRKLRQDKSTENDKTLREKGGKKRIKRWETGKSLASEFSMDQTNE